jgi:hypothetical protein
VYFYASGAGLMAGDESRLPAALATLVGSQN